MKKLKKQISLFFRLSLLLVFVAYYGSITMFFHAHNVNGHIIVHSHPFSRNKNNTPSYPSHSHTSEELILISHLDQFNCDNLFIDITIPEPVVFQYEQTQGPKVIKIQTACLEFARLRAPPACYLTA
jgi:hypothetical protein